MKKDNATFISVWDGGYAVSTRCTVDAEARTICNIEMAPAYDEEGTELEHLDEQYVVMDGCDKTRYPAVESSDFDPVAYRDEIVFTY